MPSIREMDALLKQAHDLKAASTAANLSGDWQTALKLSEQARKVRARSNKAEAEWWGLGG